MALDLLSDRTDSAAANMAADLLMLQHYPATAHARFRHYGWRRPAVTFGYSQKIAWVRQQLPADIDAADVEFCRRPTGGGVVDHRNDWTYALVIPRGHDLGDARATIAYEAIHRAVCTCLREQAVPAELKAVCEPCDDETAVGPGVCFTKPELHDVVHAESGAKIAGAAQKRSKHGLLFQGSIARGSVSKDLDWDRFHAAFTAALAMLLQLDARETSWPDSWDEALDALAESYATPEWNERR